ncbi:MAG TPA: lysophospholipid acyltransferase family protein [Candidatus Bathyarchaeia archaeon]|nr:lysophospholipid acyltransferase family protein [Candidatus Bathyarchaeia archaeon]
MKNHDRSRGIGRGIARQAGACFVWLSKALSFSLFCQLVRSLVFVSLYYTNSRLVRHCRRSIGIAYGDEKTPVEQKQLLVDSLRHLGQTLAETIYYTHNLKFVEGKIEIDGREHLDQALARGKGVVAVTAHFGNFPVMIYWMSRCGYKVNVIMRRLRDEKIGDYVFEKVTATGTKIIYTLPSRQCIQAALAALRGNEILFILLDQNYGADARVMVNFFGHEAATGTSPVVFAQRTGAAVLPVFCLRKEPDRQVIKIDPEILLQPADGTDNRIQYNVQLLTEVIERYIRQYPAWWAWMHNRWKGEE